MHDACVPSTDKYFSWSPALPWTRPAAPVPRPRVPTQKIHYEGHSAERLAALTGAHITSARRWKRHGAPAPIAKLLRILLDGELGEVSDDWRGWHLVRGRLYGHDELNFAPSEVLALPYQLARIGALQQRVAELTEVRRYEVQADWIEGRFVAITAAIDCGPATTAPPPPPRAAATVTSLPARAGAGRP